MAVGCTLNQRGHKGGRAILAGGAQRPIVRPSSMAIAVQPTAWLMVHRLPVPFHSPQPARYPLRGGQLRAARQAQPGLSVTLLAAVVAVTPATIYQYEAGHHRPRRTTLRRLATVLHLDYHALVALVDYPPGLPSQ
jgi:DNA-binding XRE family transcriptional regulator